MVGQIVDDLLVDIVLDLEEFGRSWVGILNSLVPDIL